MKVGFIPYFGGKRQQSAKIIGALPPHRRYVEVFFGGGSIFWEKEASREEVVNDRDARIVTLLRVAQRHPDALIEELHNLIYSRRLFEDSLRHPGQAVLEQ